MACTVGQENSQEQLIQHLESAIPPFDGTESGGEILAWIAPKLNTISPDGDDEELCRIVRAVHKHLAGDDDGLELLCRWCSKGNNDRSRSEIEALWYSIRPAPKADPDTDHNESPIASEASLQDSTSVIARAVANALDRYTINGLLEEIECRAIEQKPVLGKLALMGQATMFYAAPNTGKTLISFSLAIEGIKAGLIDPTKLYYINNDDTTAGLAEKLRIAEEYGFHMLAEAYRNFDAHDLLDILNHMIDNDQAHGVIVIVDTATKVVNVLDATRTRAFTKVVRKFVLKGGTLIALAHANKNPGADGKPVYRGTTDVINDFDCAYVLSQLQVNAGEKVVEFENKKLRGNVPKTAAFSYSNESGLSYHELLASVTEVDVAKLDEFKQIETLRSDADLIAIVRTCITDGIVSKMRLADAVAERAGVSKRVAIKIIERYTGNNPVLHRWQFSVQERGAKVYSLLGTSSPPTASEGSSD